MAREVLGEFGDSQFSQIVFKHRDSTHVHPIIVTVEADFDRLMPRDGQGHDTPGLPPVRCALIDEGVNADPVNFLEVIAVDVEEFSTRVLAGSIIAGHMDERQRVIDTEAVAQGLYRTL